MICPYCGGEMEKGAVVCDGRRTPSWRSENEMKKVAIVRFNLLSLFNTYKIQSNYCETCKKIVIDTED